MVAVASFASGNTEIGIAQVINLVTIVFSMFNPTCFTGDTPVYTDDGLICIEDIQIGDEVLAYNPETGETAFKEVLNVWVKEIDEILHVSTSDGETIDTTTNHPFYVENKGWVAASDLEIGDTLVTADGDEVEVIDIEFEKLDEPILVYNLEIQDFHTYFVGEYGVLVHNYIGDNGQNVDSKTTWQNGKTERIDVENPVGRDGNIHYHNSDNIKYYYDLVKETFSGLSKTEIKNLYKKPGFKEGLEKALRYLGIK